MKTILKENGLQTNSMTLLWFAALRINFNLVHRCIFAMEGYPIDCY